VPPSTLFLPFTPNGQATERLAIEVKERLGLGAYDAVDPDLALVSISARLVDPHLIIESCTEAASVLFGSARDEWSAVCFGKSPCDGREMILLNPTHHEHRKRATLMEEIVHIVLDHPRTELRVGNPGSTVALRSYDEATEDEAYNVGAACLIPYRALFHAVKTVGETASRIAARHRVSEAYVDFRIRRSGLSRVYEKRQRLPHKTAR
jgi:Zn-dependent peptidase ImmA (M78 family)